MMFFDNEKEYNEAVERYNALPQEKKEDHKRLAECLKQCKCKWLIAIGKTDFIKDLYKEYNIVEYDKTYMYQAKGEYDSKHTTHLVITNYEIKNL